MKPREITSKRGRQMIKIAALLRHKGDVSSLIKDSSDLYSARTFEYRNDNIGISTEAFFDKDLCPNPSESKIDSSVRCKLRTSLSTSMAPLWTRWLRALECTRSRPLDMIDVPLPWMERWKSSLEANVTMNLAFHFRWFSHSILQWTSRMNPFCAVIHFTQWSRPRREIRRSAVAMETWCNRISIAIALLASIRFTEYPRTSIEYTPVSESAEHESLANDALWAKTTTFSDASSPWR